jgi:O-antigen/teichoic acid export membrane protein
MAATSFTALALFWPDFLAWNASWREIHEVTQRQLRMAGWSAGNTLAYWFTDSGFILIVVGAVLGPAQVGAARAVQNLVSIANPLLLALENFAPSAATKSLTGAGPAIMLKYIQRVSFLGALGILSLTVALTVFVDPILLVVYGQTFADAAVITAILGSCLALGHVTSVIYAGLRALKRLRATFICQAVVGAICLATAWPVAAKWGVVGALSEMLVARIVVAGLFALSLRRHTRDADGATAR